MNLKTRRTGARHAVVAMGLMYSMAAPAADAPKPADSPVAPLMPKAAQPMTLVLSHDGCSMTDHVHPRQESPAVLLAFLAPMLATVGQKVVTAAVGYGYDHVTTWLGHRQADYTASSSATRSTLFYGADRKPAFACIELARGDLTAASFDPAVYEGSVKAFSKVLPDVWRDPEAAHSRFNQWHLTALPSFYMAFGVEFAPALTAAGNQASNAALYMKVRPYELLYLQSGAKRNGDEGKQVVVRLTLTGADGTAISDQTFDLGTLKPGRLYNLDYLGATYVAVPALRPVTPPASAAAASASPPAARAKGVVPANVPQTAAVAPVGDLIDPMPITITAIVTEMEQGGDLARAVYTQLADDATRKSVVDAATKEAAEQIGNVLSRYQAGGTAGQSKP